MASPSKHHEQLFDEEMDDMGSPGYADSSMGRASVNPVRPPADVETGATAAEAAPAVEAPAAEPERGNFVSGTKEVLLGRKLNILLVLVPVAFFLKFTGGNETLLFIFSLLALCPLAERIAFVTEDVCKITSETIGGLLNATMGNITELIVSIMALSQGHFTLVKTSLLGSVLSNLFLVLGCSYCAGAMRHKSQTFNKVGATAQGLLLLLATVALICPSYIEAYEGKAALGEEHGVETLYLSRVISILLMVLYGVFINFQLFTHKEMFEDDHEADAEDADEDEEPNALGFAGGVAWLAILTAIIAVLSEAIVDTVDHAAEEIHLPVTFIGAILLPIVGNAAEHASALIFAYRNKVDLAIGIAVGSGVQIALFVFPFCVVLGWAIGKPLNLDFPLFEANSLILLVVLANFFLASGEANYLKGILLIFTYLIVGACYFVHRIAPEGPEAALVESVALVTGSGSGSGSYSGSA